MERKRLRTALAALFACSVLFVGPSASAGPEAEQCAAAADKAQQMRDEGKYRIAREQMLLCARDVCPGPIKTDCGKWLTDLDRDAPTVVFGAKDQSTTPPRDVTDVKVSIDGVSIVERLDGKPMIVDAGEHTFTFEYQGKTREERALIRAAEKGRPITVSFGVVPVVKKDEEGSIVPAVVVGSLGIVALGSFAIFGIGGKNDVDDLQKCKPNCPDSDVESARTKLIIADISLGVGIVALGVATYMFLTRPKIEAKTQATGVRLNAGPIAGGAAAGIGGIF
jgi:hypothetical protein